MNSQSIAPPDRGDQALRLVWDLPLRLAHWGLALAVIGAFVTDWLGTSAFNAHVVFGSSALVIALFRVVWGFVGPAHARFSDFVRGPRAVVASLPALTRASHRRFVGHTPLGGWMALALLALVIAQATLGLFSNDEVSHTGPLYGYAAGHLSDRLSAWHGRIGNAILGAVVLHFAAVLYHRFVLRDDLIRPLLTGYKRGVGATAAIDGHRAGVALVILAMLVAALWWLLSTAPDATLEL